MKELARIIATAFGVGHLRPAPGTWGALAALPLAWGLHLAGGFPLFLMGTAAIFILGVWATARMTEGASDHDPSEIVIDEVAGQLVALMPLSSAADRLGIDMTVLWPGWIAAFVLFRLFDIWKPGPVGWADRRRDPLGVMLDDVIAGALAAIGVLALAFLAHRVLLA